LKCTRYKRNININANTDFSLTSQGMTCIMMNSNWVAETLRPMHSGALGGQFDDPICEDSTVAVWHPQSTDDHSNMSLRYEILSNDYCAPHADVTPSFEEPVGLHKEATRALSPSSHEVQSQTSLPLSPLPTIEAGSYISDAGVTPHDVLCGRGGGTNQHAGNKVFRQLCDEYRPAYVNHKEREMKKSDVVRTIVNSVRANGGRFLRRHKAGQGWVEVSDKEALSKTSQAMRDGMAQSRRRRAVRAHGAKAEFYLGEVVQNQPSGQVHSLARPNHVDQKRQRIAY